MLQFVESQRRKLFLIYQNFLFLKERRCADGKEIWRCREHTNKDVKVSSLIIVRSNNHSIN